MIRGSRTPEEEKDRARTPQWLFEWARRAFGGFDVDLAANATNAKCGTFYSLEFSALGRSWSRAFPDGKGWCNPPYNGIGPWVEQAIIEGSEGFTTVMLIPSFNGERWGMAFDLATAVLNIVGRIAFERPDGTPMTGNPRGSSLVVFGPTNECKGTHYLLRKSMRYDIVSTILSEGGSS